MTSAALRYVFIIAVAAMPLGGCKTLASAAVNTAASLAGPAPAQALTLGDAQRLATLATNAADLAVNTGKLPRSVLVEINTLSDALHAAVNDLEAANAKGQSLNFAAFNAALDAYNVYMTAHPTS